MPGGRTHRHRHRAHRPDTVVSGSTAVAASELRCWGSGRVGAGNGPSRIDQTAFTVHLQCIFVHTSATGAGVTSAWRAHKRDHHTQPRVAEKEKGAGEASVRAITRITRSRSPNNASAGRGLTPHPSPRPQIHTRNRGRPQPPLTPTPRRWWRRRLQRRQQSHTSQIAKPPARLRAVSKGKVQSGDTWIEE